MTDLCQSSSPKEEWIEKFKPLIDEADHHRIDFYYDRFPDSVGGALNAYFASKNNNVSSEMSVHLASFSPTAAQSTQPPQSEEEVCTDTSDNQREAPLPDDVATSEFTDASVLHYFENNDSNSSFTANNTTTSANAQSNIWSPPTVAAASSKQPSKSILSPRKRTVDDAPSSSRPADTKKLFSRAPSSSLLSPDGISGFITSTPAANPSQPIEDDQQQSNLGIPTSASLPNVPPAQQTSKGLMSRRPYIPIDELKDLSEYNGSNDELLRNLHGYDEDKAASELKKLLGQKGGAVSFDQLKHVSKAASTISTNINTNALGHGAMQRVVMTDHLRERMNKTLDGLDIQFNESTPCVVDGCKTPACTSRKAKKPSPPFSIPFSHCTKHALQLSEDTGEEFVYLPCKNEHGEERDVQEGDGIRSLCYWCLTNQPCKIEGCTKGGNGNTYAGSGLCKGHHNQIKRQCERARYIRNKDVQKCRRCGEGLDGYLVPVSGAAKDICSRSECKKKCVMVVGTSPDDGKEDFCSKDRVVIRGTSTANCYCSDHSKQAKAKQRRESKQNRERGQTKWWTEVETNCLMRVVDKPQYSKMTRKGKQLLWKEVEKAVRDEFEANDLDRNKFTIEQMKERRRTMNRER